MVSFTALLKLIDYVAPERTVFIAKSLSHDAAIL